MAIVRLKEMLADARANHYAVPMFDVSNTTMIRAAVETAEEMKSPVILAAIPPDITGASLGYWANAARYAAERARVPVCLHLDHAADAALCLACAENGFQSVMIDASAKPFEENIAITRGVARMMNARGIDVEAELGHVATGITGGDCGVGENGLSEDSQTVFTDPDSVVRFVRETGVAALAVSIGTTHGVYVAAPELNIELLKKINRVAEVPLVLHGGSGTPAEQLDRAIANGISKINIYSELTAAWHGAMRDFLTGRQQMTCWFSVACKKPDEAMRNVMRAKIREFHAAGRA